MNIFGMKISLPTNKDMLLCCVIISLAFGLLYLLLEFKHISNLQFGAGMIGVTIGCLLNACGISASKYGFKGMAFVIVVTMCTWFIIRAIMLSL